ncbi:MAG: hypothetical protein RR624_03675 [Longicatena sp.]
MVSEAIEKGNRLLKEINTLLSYINILTQGNFLERNPYWHSTKTKKVLVAIHESVNRSIEDIFLFSACVTKLENQHERLLAYFETYAFLFDFYDDIKRQEMDHRLLMKDQTLLTKFNELAYSSEYYVQELERIEVCQ